MDAFIHKCVEKDNKLWGNFFALPISTDKLEDIPQMTVVKSIKDVRYRHIPVYVYPSMEIIVTKKFIDELTEEELAAFMTYRLNGKVKYDLIDKHL